MGLGSSSRCAAVWCGVVWCGVECSGSRRIHCLGGPGHGRSALGVTWKVEAETSEWETHGRSPIHTMSPPPPIVRF